MTDSLLFIAPKIADRKLRGVYASAFTPSLLFRVQKVVVVVVVIVVVSSSSSSGGGNTGKAIPVQVWTGLYGFRRSRLPEYRDNWHMKVARLPVLHTGRLYPLGYPW